MKLKIKTFLKFFFVFFIGFAAVCIVAVFNIVGEINTKVYKHTELKSEVAKSSIIEKFSKVNKEDLAFFNEFTINPIKELDLLTLDEEQIELSALIENKCDRVQCIQEKTSFEDFPSSIWRSLVGVEDSRFLDHKGVDFLSILRAIVIDIKEMRLAQGGSTLTQQLAKNIFLTNEKSFVRKIKEVIYAVVLEGLYTKEEILSLYLNESFWGSIGNVYVKGVSSASRIYFGKRIQDIDDYEAAILIGMLKGPNFYHPLRYTDRLKKRTEVVVGRLKAINYYNSKLEWTDEKWNHWEKKLAKKTNKKSSLKNIYLTLNEDLENKNFEVFILKQAVSRFLISYKDQDLGVKFYKVQKNCNEETCLEYSYYSKAERDLADAINSEYHQVGSILKPFIYYNLINLGKSLEDIVSTKPITLNLLSGKWTPKDSKSAEEFITIKQALQKSKNIPLIRTAKEVGFDKLEEKLKGKIPRLMSPLKEYPAQLLGAVELSLREVAVIYKEFIDKVCKENKAFIEVLTDASQTTLSKRASEIIKSTRIFGKTGTTNNGLDAWFIADDGAYFYIVWAGLETKRQGIKLNLYGAGSAFKIFQDYLLNRGKQVPEFYCNTKR